MIYLKVFPSVLGAALPAQDSASGITSAGLFLPSL